MARTPLLRAIQKHFQSQLNLGSKLSLRPGPTADRNPVLAPSPSRRNFIAGTSTFLLGAALPKFSYAAKKEKKIVIVGGGISGLACALKLQDHGLKAMVYEASGRLGGRMFSNAGYWNDKQVSEWGGELIDTGHKTIRQMARRFNLTLDNVLHAEPKNSEDTYYFDHEYYPKSQFLLDAEPVIERVVEDLKAADYPTTYDNFTEAGRALDQLSIYDWIETRVSGGHASALGQLLDVAYVIEFGADTRDQSALNLVYLLAYQPTHGDANVFGESDEAFHIRGGNEELPRVIAKQLGPDRFQLGQQLMALENLGPKGYKLTFKNGQGSIEPVLADIVVLALPFSVLRKIDLSLAGFDALKQTAIQELGLGKNAKTQLQFQKRIWNETGAWPAKSNGSTYTDAGYQCSWDVTRAQPGENGILNFFSGGSVTQKMSTTQPFTTSVNPLAVKDASAALESAENVFPGLTKKWNHKLTQSIPHLSPFMRASYAYYRVGQYTQFGGYEGKPQGQIYFCGDHCSQDYQGYMEGAASEGERAADEVMKS